mmetsp:Transcript_80780/g.135129  ORF Transcript_80780/g.135129 Transcript_80780/m.135129 type:complete len:260 (+) Transcript_80780:871-1650(+)
MSHNIRLSMNHRQFTNHICTNHRRTTIHLCTNPPTKLRFGTNRLRFGTNLFDTHHPPFNPRHHGLPFTGIPSRRPCRIPFTKHPDRLPRPCKQPHQQAFRLLHRFNNPRQRRSCHQPPKPPHRILLAKSLRSSSTFLPLLLPVLRPLSLNLRHERSLSLDSSAWELCMPCTQRLKAMPARRSASLTSRGGAFWTTTKPQMPSESWVCARPLMRPKKCSRALMPMAQAMLRKRSSWLSSRTIWSPSRTPLTPGRWRLRCS